MQNGNGLLEPEEFLMLCWRIGCPLKESELSDVYASLDSSNNGVVCFDEFSVWLNDHGKRRISRGASSIKRRMSKGMLSLPHDGKEGMSQSPFWLTFDDPALEVFHRQYEASQEFAVRQSLFNVLLLTIFGLYPLLDVLGSYGKHTIDLLVTRFAFTPLYLICWLGLNCSCFQVKENYSAQQVIVLVRMTSTIWRTIAVQSLWNPALLVEVVVLMLCLLLLRPCMLVACIVLSQALFAGIYLNV
jgi:hypothetical protein